MSLIKFLSIGGYRGTLWSLCQILGTPITSFGIWLFMISFSFGHTFSLTESDKQLIWRIRNPEDKRGTGFILAEIEADIDTRARTLLVTNKHMVMSDSGQYFDSVIVYRNEITSAKKVMSSDSTWVMYLRYKGVKLFVEHSDQDVDLVIIQVGPIDIDGERVMNPKGLNSLVGWPTTLVADTRSLKIKDGTRIQMIGFPLLFAQTTTYPISRFGYVSNYAEDEISLVIDKRIWTSEWIIADASARGGHSGGPVFANVSNTENLHLIGFVQAGSENSELTYIIPAHYILDLLKTVRTRFLRIPK